MLLLSLNEILTKGVLHLRKGLFDDFELLFDLDDLVLFLVDDSILVSDQPSELCNVHVEGTNGFIFLDVHHSKLLVLVFKDLKLVSHTLKDDAVFATLFQEGLLILLQLGLEVTNLLFHLIFDGFQLFLMLRFRRSILLTLFLQKLLILLFAFNQLLLELLILGFQSDLIFVVIFSILLQHLDLLLLLI